MIRQASQHVQHMQKGLEQMNLKLTEILSDITGVTGRAIIRVWCASRRGNDPGGGFSALLSYPAVIAVGLASSVCLAVVLRERADLLRC